MASNAAMAALAAGLADEPAGRRLRDAGRCDADSAGGGQPAAHGECAHDRRARCPGARVSLPAQPAPNSTVRIRPRRSPSCTRGWDRQTSPAVCSRSPSCPSTTPSTAAAVPTISRRRRTPGRSCSRTIRHRARVATIRASARRWICTIAASPKDWPAARATRWISARAAWRCPTARCNWTWIRPVSSSAATSSSTSSRWRISRFADCATATATVASARRSPPRCRRARDAWIRGSGRTSRCPSPRCSASTIRAAA